MLLHMVSNKAVNLLLIFEVFHVHRISIFKPTNVTSLARKHATINTTETVFSGVKKTLILVS